MTGGITPVYAAPETFDGVVTRFCDQYSLASVYQELLTGVRPFDGTSMSQLLMQHLNLPPNLDPSPAVRPAGLARALAKKPEDRWPSVAAFVRGLLSGSASGRLLLPRRDQCPRPWNNRQFDRPRHRRRSTPRLSRRSTPNRPRSPRGETPPGQNASETGGPVFTPAPPESRGPGPLRPALVIGLGQTGLSVLRRLRFELTERYGQPEMLPIMQSLYIDTDPEDLDAAPSRTRRTTRGARCRRCVSRPVAAIRTLPEAAPERAKPDRGVVRPADALQDSPNAPDDGRAHVRPAGVLRPLPLADGEDSRGHR